MPNKTQGTPILIHYSLELGSEVHADQRGRRDPKPDVLC